MTTKLLAAAQCGALLVAVHFIWGLRNSKRVGLDPALLNRQSERTWKLVAGTFAGVSVLVYVPLAYAFIASAASTIATVAVQALRIFGERHPKRMLVTELLALASVAAAVVATYVFLPGWRVLWPESITKALLGSMINFSFAAVLATGGSYIVRGVLELCGTLPRQPSLKDLDQRSVEDQLRAGRYIGVLERIIVFTFAYFGSFEAIGLLGAAKGWVRSKQFDEDRQFAEYFLVGTLTSIAIAVLAGVTARSLVTALLAK